MSVRDALGRVYRESGDFPNSVQAYRDAVKAFPNSAVLQANLALASADSKDFPAAAAAMSKAISLAPRDDRLKAAQIAISYTAGGADRALATATSFAKENPQDPAGDILAADVLDRSGKRAQGIALLDKTMSAHPSVPVLLKEVVLLEKDNNLKRAITLLEGWTKAHPADVEPRYQLAQYYGRVRNYDAARGEFEKLVAERPSDPIVLNNLAWFYARANDPRARKMAEKAMQMAPQAPDIADTLGWIMTSQGDAQGAMKYLQMALTGLPKNPDVQYHMALALSKTNKVQDARAMLQKALASTEDFDSKADAKQLLDKLGVQPATGPVTR
jgi:Flp pilus assembly protein TadD